MNWLAGSGRVVSTGEPSVCLAVALHSVVSGLCFPAIPATPFEMGTETGPWRFQQKVCCRRKGAFVGGTVALVISGCRALGFLRTEWGLIRMWTLSLHAQLEALAWRWHHETLGLPLDSCREWTEGSFSYGLECPYFSDPG